jgi:SAM-dependent methyltransferase
MDADFSHPPGFVADMWANRLSAEIVIASRYAAGGIARMSAGRYVLSRILNTVFARGLSLPIKDLSSGFRLYKAAAVKGRPFMALNLDILQEILVRAYADGWKVQEIPFRYSVRRRGSSAARVVRFGLDYLRTFGRLWTLRNSILAADYDGRAYDGPIFVQRYWQRSRFRHIVELTMAEGRVLDVGCGSSRIIGALRPDSVAMDVLLRKLRYSRRYSRPLVHASGFSLPFDNASFPCVLCSEVIEHVPKDSTILLELERVLAPGGRLVLGTPDYSHWEWVVIEKLYGALAPGGYADEHIAHYTRAELVTYFEDRGLALEETRYIARSEMIMAFRKKRS